MLIFNWFIFTDQYAKRGYVFRVELQPVLIEKEEAKGDKQLKCETIMDACIMCLTRISIL